MTIFITGSNGFIGSHLKEYLQRYYPQYTLLTPTRHELDLVDECAVDEYMLYHPVDIIIHAANRGGGRDTMEMKNITEYNLRVFFNIAKHEKNVQKIICFGSGAEYAKHKPIVDVREDDYLHFLPLDEYGFYKSITSRYIAKADKIVQLRIFGCYGEYENYRFKFISNAIVKNLLQLPITINQNVFFDYIYVDDLLRMIDYCLHHEMKEKIYNASRGEKVDLLTLGQIVNDNADFQSEIVMLNSGLNNEYTSNADRIISEMGGFEFTSHANAMVKMKNYFQAQLTTLDIEMIKNDPYLKAIDTIWKP
jgi:nucleoside-diphosphate-sugar epimerase